MMGGRGFEVWAFEVSALLRGRVSRSVNLMGRRGAIVIWSAGTIAAATIASGCSSAEKPRLVALEPTTTTAPAVAADLGSTSTFDPQLPSATLPVDPAGLGSTPGAAEPTTTTTTTPSTPSSASLSIPEAESGAPQRGAEPEAEPPATTDRGAYVARSLPVAQGMARERTWNPEEQVVVNLFHRFMDDYYLAQLDGPDQTSARIRLEASEGINEFGFFEQFSTDRLLDDAQRRGVAKRLPGQSSSAWWIVEVSPYPDGSGVAIEACEINDIVAYDATSGTLLDDTIGRRYWAGATADGTSVAGIEVQLPEGLGQRCANT